MTHVSLRYWFTDRSLIRYTLLSKEPANIYEYCLSQPTTAPRNSSRSLSATKSSTHLFLVGPGTYSSNSLFSECSTHYTDPRRSAPMLSVMFMTGISTAAAFQLFSTDAPCLCLI